MYIPDLAYRFLGIWLCYAAGEKVCLGYVERVISPWRDLFDFYKITYRRDTSPILYWMEMGQMTIAAMSGLCVALFGWWHPPT